MRKILALVLLGLAIASPVRAEYVIKFSHVVSPKTPKGIAAQWFADQVNERLKGRVKVEVFPNSQLYNDNKVLEAMRLASGNTGIMAAPSLSKFVKFSRQLQAFDLPFLFHDLDDVHRLTGSPLAKEMVAPLERRGLKGLAFWDNGMKVFSVRGERPLRKVPQDFQGKKFRIQSSNVHQMMIESLGGIPQKLPFKEVYTALAQGVVDGQENAWSNIYSKRFYEVQDWITVSDHSYLGYLVVVSGDFWRRLPPDLRDQLEGILAEATEVAQGEARRLADEDRRQIEASGKVKVVGLTPKEREAWQRATAQVEKRFAHQIGEDLLRRIHQLLGH